MGYEYLEHKADIGMRVFADTLEGILHDAALGLFNIIYDANTVSPIESFPLQAKAPTHELLIVEFLNELISLMDRKDVFLNQCNAIRITEDKKGKEMCCTVSGETRNPRKHRIKTEVKATTYSGLALEQVNNQYIFQCLFDI